MAEQNPYAPPAADVSKAPAKRKARKRKTIPEESQVWRDGACVVMAKEGARLPERCVVCNSPVAGDLVPRQFTWHPPWVYALIVCGWLPYMIFAASMRKGARVEIGLCELHQTRRRHGLILAWGGAAGAVALLLLGAGTGAEPIVWAGVLTVILFPIIGSRMARVAYPERIDDQHIWLRVGAPFLESIAE